jgi:hypothetical protein
VLSKHYDRLELSSEIKYLSLEEAARMVVLATGTSDPVSLSMSHNTAWVTMVKNGEIQRLHPDDRRPIGVAELWRDDFLITVAGLKKVCDFLHIDLIITGERQRGVDKKVTGRTLEIIYPKVKWRAAFNGAENNGLSECFIGKEGNKKLFSLQKVVDWIGSHRSHAYTPAEALRICQQHLETHSPDFPARASWHDPLSKMSEE